MLAVAMEQDAHSLGVVRAAGSFAVNVLESGQRELAGQFGRAYAKVGDKLAGHPWQAGSTGAPVLICERKLAGLFPEAILNLRPGDRLKQPMERDGG